MSNTYLVNCAHCHGTEGEISALGRSKILKDMSKEEILEKMSLYREGKLNTHGMGGLMKAKLLEIEGSDYTSIVEYLTNLKKKAERNKTEE